MAAIWTDVRLATATPGVPDGGLRDNGAVPWRRFLLFATLLLVAASLVSALAPSDRRFGQPPRALEPPPPAPTAAARSVEAALPRTRPVRARVGDVVRLTVRAPAADTVELAALGVEAPADPQTPGELLFTADQVGSFPVRLRDADEAVGSLQVTR